MALSLSANDQRTADLIGDAQRYSNPTGQDPSPPSIAYPAPVGDTSDQQLNRTPRPPWFEPADHPDDPEGPTSDEVPVIDGAGEIADPSVDERSRIQAAGIDALAYYAPFHFFRRNQWGIYIRDYGIAFLTARFLGRSALTQSDNWVLRCAYWLLLEHEYFHFQTEIAATHYEMLTGHLKSYAQLFHDRRAHWLEESMANARAHRMLEDREDGELESFRIDQFKGFASNWMKTEQPHGYRDFDKWYKSNSTMNKGLAAMTSRLHEISCHLNKHSWRSVSSEVLRLYEGADYSFVPVVRVPDPRISWLKSARLFPKAMGIQVMVYTREHIPIHIHVDFLNREKSVRLEWPSLSPLPGERTLSSHERKKLHSYLSKYQTDIREKLQKVYQQTNLPLAL
jgi:hypothetical protein